MKQTLSLCCDYNDSEVEKFEKWLALELSPMIFSNKPATILTLANTKQQSLLNLWRQYGAGVINRSSIDYLVLKELPQRITILFYRSDLLTSCINEKSHKEFLKACAYPVDDGIEACLQGLYQRFATSCPHEVGIFLGIPYKDVLGFMGLSNQPITCRGFGKFTVIRNCHLL